MRKFVISQTIIPEEASIPVSREIFVPEMIISGGQRGADYGGLEGAADLNIPTGGVAPKGWRTEYGSAPELGSKYGLVESNSPEYPPRTRENVAMCDATILICHDFESPGSVMTINLCMKLGKAFFSVPFGPNMSVESSTLLLDLRDWMLRREPAIVNIAGNRESKARGIQSYSRNLVRRLFSASV